MYYGLDVHKEFIQVCVLGPKGEARKEYRVGGSADRVEAFAKGLRPNDQVVCVPSATLRTGFESSAAGPDCGQRWPRGTCRPQPLARQDRSSAGGGSPRDRTGVTLAAALLPHPRGVSKPPDSSTASIPLGT